MTSRLKDIPRLARDGKNLNAVVEGVLEALQTFRGYRGDPLDKALTPRDFAPGMLGGNVATGGTGGITIIGGGAGTGAGGGTAYEPDLTAPPTATFPAGRLVTAGLSSIFIESDPQTYTQGHRHDRTVVYGAKWPASDPTAPTFSEAVELFSFQGTFGAYGSDPATRWCIWIKWRSNDGVLSVDPAGGTNGQQDTTGQDVSGLLEALELQLTSSQLATALSTRIDLIDDPDSVVGSVAARIKAEADARDAAVTLLTGDLALESDARDLADTVIGNSVAAEVSARSLSEGIIAAAMQSVNAAAAAIGASVRQEVVERSTADTAVASQVVALTASTGQGIAAITVEQEARSAADANTASQVTSLIATFASGTGDPVNAAALLVEQTVRADADGAQASQVTSLAASSGATAAALVVEQTTRATENEALSQSVLTVSAEAAAGKAAVVVEQLARSDENSVLASQLTSLSAASAAGAAALTVEQIVRAGSDSVQASETTSLAARMGIGDAASEAAIVVERDVRTTADSAQASASTALTASLGASLAVIKVEQDARAAADSAQASATTGLAAGLGGATAALLTEQLVRVTQDTALGQTASTLTAGLAGNTAAVLGEQIVRVTADNVMASTSASLVASTANTTAAITSERQTNATASTATARSLDALAVTAGNVVAGLVTEQSARVASDSAVTTAITTLSATTSNAQAAIRTEQDTRVSDVTAVAGNVTTLQSRLDSVGGGASLEVRANTTASAITGLSGQYTVKIDLAGYVTGYGLASTVVDGAPTSEFTIRADAFTIAPVTTDNTASDGSPFFYRTSSTVIDGVTVPAGAYLKAAFIHDASITNAKIANLAVDDAKVVNLNVAKLTAGSLNVGAYIQSTSYSSGSGFTPGSGFRISGNGDTEFNNTTVRGTVYATAGILRGLTIQASDGSTIVNAGASAATTTFAGNVTGSVAGTAASTLVTTASNALADANQALSDAFDANAKLADIYADGKLTPVEKQAIRSQWDAIYAERADIRSKADAMGGVATEKNNYDNAFEDLGDYLNGGTAYTIGTTRPLWIRDATELGNTTTISGDVFRATWATLYTARQALLNKIAEVAATKANWTGIASRPGDEELLNTQGDFQAIHSWGFNGAADGWTSAGMSTVTPNASTITLVSAGGDPNFHSPVISISGAASTKVRVRLRRLSGALPAGFDCYYKTSAFVPNWNGAYYKNIVPPATMTVGAWVVVEFDMAALTAGTGGGAGYEWIGSTITQIRLDFGAATGDTYEIDWIAIGSSAPGSYGAPTGSPVGDTTADVVAAAAAAVNDGATGLAQRLRSNAQNVLSGAGGLSTGTLAWNASGVRIGGYGVGITQQGIVAYNAAGQPTFTLNGNTGDATFAGTLAASTVTTANIVAGSVSTNTVAAGGVYASGYLPGGTAQLTMSPATLGSKVSAGGNIILDQAVVIEFESLTSYAAFVSAQMEVRVSWATSGGASGNLLVTRVGVPVVLLSTPEKVGRFATLVLPVNDTVLGVPSGQTVTFSISLQFSRFVDASGAGLSVPASTCRVSIVAQGSITELRV